MRLKSKWHKKDKNHTLEDNAHALAFICWQIAVDRVKNMERWNYYIDLPERTLSVISEFLIYLAHLVDRATYEAYTQEERSIFLNALVKRLSEIVEDNRQDVGDLQSKQEFTQRVNSRFADYAQCPFNDNEPSYAVFRYLGQNIAHIIGESHNKGVVEQIMEVEGPEANHVLRKGMRNLIGL